MCPYYDTDHYYGGNTSTYALGYGQPTLPTASGTSVADGGLQEGWRYCYNCANLFWAAGGLSGGYCLDTAQAHRTEASYSNYDMIISPVNYGAPVLLNQPGWLLCNNCKSLFFGHGGTTSGLCAKPRSDGTLGPHIVEDGSSTYSVMTAS